MKKTSSIVNFICPKCGKEESDAIAIRMCNKCTLDRVYKAVFMVPDYRKQEYGRLKNVWNKEKR